MASSGSVVGLVLVGRSMRILGFTGFCGYGVDDMVTNVETTQQGCLSNTEIANRDNIQRYEDLKRKPNNCNARLYFNK
jgi:hypothetical protein